MKIKRQLTWDMYCANFCPNCAETRSFKRIGGFPGVFGVKCETCETTLNINFLENSDDEIEVPYDFISGISKWENQKVSESDSSKRS